MPILDPVLQFNLSSINNSKSEAYKQFLIYYLQVASENINQNFSTILASIQFKKDFDRCLSIISKYLSFSFQGKKEEFPNIYYTILYQNEEFEKKNCNFPGNYYQYSILNSSFKFFKLNIDNSTYRSWFFSDFPIAILCLHLNKIRDDDLSLVIFELDLMAAAGFTLILCINDFTNCKLNNFDQLIEILYSHFISEIHITYNSSKYDEAFYKFTKALNENYDEFKSYFYFYIRYFEMDENIMNSQIAIPLLNLNKSGNNNTAIPLADNSKDSSIKKLIENLDQLESKSLIKITYFSDPIEKSLKSHKLTPSQPFNFCKTGFEKNILKIFLSDIPLYDKESEKSCPYSCDFANIGKYNYHCYINPDDFLSSDKTRIKVLYILYKKEKSSKEEQIIKFVNYKDIHYINPDLYVNSQLSLMKTKSYIKEKCMSIITKLENNYVPKEPDSKRSTKNSPRRKKKEEENKSNNLEESFTRSLYLYKVRFDQKFPTKFKFNLSQIYTAYEIVESCFNFNIGSLGSIYQIPTGEGKSAIISLIAATLAQMGKKVHIVTSNYVLTNRDYNESFDYFNILGLNSTALLHYNEVPIYNKIDNDPTIRTSHYPDEFFGHTLFDNSMRMNFDVCSEKKKASIVFSTITNFQCFYLYMTEKSKENIDNYYKNTVLLVDEADSILIDEITNGTIISRPLNSNSQKILTFVYNEYTNNDKISSTKLRNDIVEKYPECKDLSVNDVENMFKEIDLVNKDDSFVDGKKYLIVNTNRKPKTEKSSKIQYKEIVPFDFDHKGIIERNKEYSGFIEQFISIKEMIKRKKSKETYENDILFKDISLNYLYISHPVYVKLYSNVFGVTGTLGGSYDKNLLLKHYKLQSKIMPKENPNRLCHFPITLCENIEQRNKLIVDEVMGFHSKGFPVLVILFSPKEIDNIEDLIKKRPEFNPKQKIRIYSGQDIKIKPNNDSGKEGAISLGTNVCGRGTHIEVGKKHLHVIVSFYSSNQRTLQQAFGRTARKDNFGSVHIICHKDEYNLGSKFIEDKEIKENLTKMEIYKLMQKEFIDVFRSKREWIFEMDLNYTKKFTSDELSLLRASKINVNRMNACTYKYPICMKYDTFIDIQTQKIYSLLNCPNCKYTWQLFQQYIREMILQSWSILINKSDKIFVSESTEINDIKAFMKEQKEKLIQNLEFYLPNDKQFDIFSTFMNIFKKVHNKYSVIRIVSLIPNGVDLRRAKLKDASLMKTKSKGVSLMKTKSKSKDISLMKEESDNDSLLRAKSIDDAELESADKKKFSRISLEFRPFSLIYKSGSRIRETFNKNPAIAYIEDPELKYKRSSTNELFSITNVLDTIFEKICNIFNDFLEEHINFKLFLRRTLAGCEFGICYDFGLENIDEEVAKLDNCLFDKDPIFVFSVYINSTIPFLAGILIFMAYYLAQIINNLINVAKTLFKGLVVTGWKLFKAIIEFVGKEALSKTEEAIIGNLSQYLVDKIHEIIEKFKNTDHERFYFVISFLVNLLTEKLIEAAYERGKEYVEQISTKFRSLKSNAKKGLNQLFKVGFLCVLYLASHMLNFQFNFLFKEKLGYTSQMEKDSEFLKANHDIDTVDKMCRKPQNMPLQESEKLRIDLKGDLQKLFK